MFEGYVGIRLWDGQLVDDMMFTLLLALMLLFALVFRVHFHHFVTMLKDVVYLKERQSLFDESTGKNEASFRFFMLFQTLFLCSITLFAVVRSRGMMHGTEAKEVMVIVAVAWGVLFLFYQFKQLCYGLLGFVFATPDKYRLWKKSYHAVMGTWGVSLYIPVVWLMFSGGGIGIPALLFVVCYLLSRMILIYKTIRIFRLNGGGLFYINLYLCGQEILPLMLLYEGIIILYNFIETSTLWH